MCRTGPLPSMLCIGCSHVHCAGSHNTHTQCRSDIVTLQYTHNTRTYIYIYIVCACITFIARFINNCCGWIDLILKKFSAHSLGPDKQILYYLSGYSLLKSVHVNFGLWKFGITSAMNIVQERSLRHFDKRFTAVIMAQTALTCTKRFWSYYKLPY